MLDTDDIEIYHDPKFEYGAKVVSRKNVRNDGTFAGKEIGEILVKKGDVGYVHSIGTFLQRYYIYGVDWIDRGYVVGMRVHELQIVEEERV